MKKRIICILAAVVLCAVTAVITFQLTTIGMADKPSDSSDAPTSSESLSRYLDDTYITEDLLEKLSELARVYNLYYVDPIDKDYFEEMLLKAFVAGAKDQFGVYYNSEDFKSAMSDMSGEYYGIGVSVLYDSAKGMIEVISVFPNTPAYEAGVLPGDYIAYVGGEAVSELGYYEAIDRMRGAEGTKADFTVLRGDTLSERVEFSVERRKVTEVTVEWKLYEREKNIAIISIYSFDGKTAEQFRSAINSALSAGAKGFIFDVRNNPGGSLDAICEILDFLLPEGPIIRIDYKGEANDTFINSDANFFDYPMVVLCNQYTASAGELFSSALQDYAVAKLVGVQTYGKGTMQTVLSLPSGGGISVTCAYYLPPKSPNYHGVGVKPDLVVELPEELRNLNVHKLTAEQDTQMQAAVVTLIEEMARREKPDGIVT